jgi:hypothetical protein
MKVSKSGGVISNEYEAARDYLLEMAKGKGLS